MKTFKTFNATKWRNIAIKKNMDLKWIAVDKDGVVYGFKHEPFVLGGRIWIDGGIGIHLGEIDYKVEDWTKCIKPVHKKEKPVEDPMKEWIDVVSYKECYRWVAMDEDGFVFAYSVKPVINGDNWDTNGMFRKLGRAVETDDWKDSLREIAQSEEKDPMDEWFKKAKEVFKYIAINKNGNVYGYSTRPFFKEKEEGWRCKEFGHYLGSIPNYKGDWKHSLRKVK